MSTNINNPIPVAWTRHVTQDPNRLEVIPHVLYDTETFTDAVTTLITFFNDVEATLDLGNTTQPGLLPNPESFLIKKLRVFAKSQAFTDDSGAAGAFVSAYNDLVLLYNTGVFQLNLGNKRYGPWPLWMIPASSFVKGPMTAAGAEAANLVHEYGQGDGPLYNLNPNLFISPMQNFNVVLSWPAGAPNLSADVVLSVVLEGQLARAVQ